MNTGLKRVVVTGMAGITGLGEDWEAIEANLRAGRNAVRRIPEWAQIEGLLRSTRLFPSEAFGDEPTRRSTSLISQRSYGRQHFPVLTIR